MTESEASPDELPELERAYENFTRILEAHTAALASIGVVATLPDPEAALAVHIDLALHRKKGRAIKDSIGPARDRLREAVDEHARGGETLRRMTIVALCGAIEYLVKAVFVSQAHQNPEEAAKLIANKKIKLYASEVVGLPASEQWFVIADRLWEALSEGYPRTYERATRLLTEHTYLAFGDDAKKEVAAVLKTADEVQLFDEAFLVRNCIVHNGGRVSSALARHSRRTRGEVLVVDKTYGTKLIRVLKEFADGVRHTEHAGLF